jgi:hypothetical protein
MSDGHTDMIEHYHRVFDECIKFMVRFHMVQAAGKLETEMTEAEYWDFHNKICSIPQTFWTDELKLPKYLQERFDGWSSAPRMPDLEELFFLLRATRKYLLMNTLQKATKYNDRLILLVDETGQVLPNGVRFQDKFWTYMDGDQDIIIGLAKKRCYKQPFIGRCPVLIAAVKYRYRKQGFSLKEVIDIHGNQLGRHDHGT